MRGLYEHLFVGSREMPKLISCVETEWRLRSPRRAPNSLFPALPSSQSRVTRASRTVSWLVGVLFPLHLPLHLARLGHRLLRIDVRHRVPIRGVLLPAGRLHIELLGQDRDQDLHLHVAEAGELLDAGGEIVAVPGHRPHPGGIAVVVVEYGLAQRLDAAGHAARKAVQRGPLSEY